MAQAQWTQMGPDAGGQERAVYIYETPTTNMYDVYVGSDVSGVWRAPNIAKGSFHNPNLYHYNFISNHEIMRFVNKFYRADNGTSRYLFCLNRSGIDRTELDNNGTMKSVPISPWNNNGNQDDSWVIDMHISPNTTNKQTYFITGNACVTDNGPGNGKDADVNDFVFNYHNATLLIIPNTAIANLQYISTLCPFAFGTSVYKARSELKRLGIDTLIYDDKATCAMLGYLRKPKTLLKETGFANQMTVSPNPSKGLITISFNNVVAANDAIQILDMDGKLVLDLKLETESNEINVDITHLQPSVYTIKYIGCKSALSAKLILIK